MVRKETIAQFERLQRESELIVEALRSVLPQPVPSPRIYRRPPLEVLDGQLRQNVASRRWAS